ncbi:MAG: hypothetical protein VB074_11815 [Proteiniphilum sp.]|uniref:hypothetical protein n=1 Tax=Proteiniphilum sp. TaxID=1926877 RepID=UPI00092CAA98|nr:hypothetical protein [Proteiniphilum sp.]MEA5128865.1 hypothetical protein [Proteiniphilum sp.]OJV88659.1 MAG: hypothetical protein BGO34_18455 [Bacteroidia bacterium 44-10]
MRLIFNLFLFTCLFSLFSCTTEPVHYGDPITQTSINRVELMPNMPQPYSFLDWEKKARQFDDYVFDFNSKLPAGPMIWLDNNRRNLPQQTFGLFTAVHDVRQGADVNKGEFHESLTSLSALLGAGLIGIDKTHQYGYNFVKMIQNYFNTDNGWNIMMNNTTPEVGSLGGGYGRDWWYDVLPNVLFYNVCEVFPGVDNVEFIQKAIAEQFTKADSVLNGNYDYSYFDYAQMKGMVNHIPLQQDAAGGHGYVLYAAYKKFGDTRYLTHAKSAIEALNNQTESRFYEVLLPIGIYTAARLNAEEGMNYDVMKMLDWVFEGTKSETGRTGWGIIADKWGEYDVSGLQGSITDGGGYAFLMNGILTAMPLVPMVKYEPQFARSIGKWMLNNVNASRFFYPDQIPDENQWLPGMQDYTNSIIAYEGLRLKDDMNSPRLEDVHPVAIGDGPKWHKDNPKESMFSLYSTAPVGIFGAMVEKTNVERILKLDCNITDFYSEKSYPFFLIYNPYEEEKKVAYIPKEDGVDLFDTISRTYLGRAVTGTVEIAIPPDHSCLVVELPADAEVKKEDGKLWVNKKIISYK